MTVANDLVEHLANHTLASKDDCKMTLASVLAGYPVLLEGLPGVGKTGLALGVAEALSLSMRRLQCTPDVQPADITGYLRPDPKGENFVFVEARFSHPACWSTKSTEPIHVVNPRYLKPWPKAP